MYSWGQQLNATIFAKLYLASLRDLFCLLSDLKLAYHLVVQYWSQQAFYFLEAKTQTPMSIFYILTAISQSF